MELYISSYDASHKATKTGHCFVFPLRVWVGKVLCFGGMDRGEVTEPVSCCPHVWILDLASIVLWWWPVEVTVGGDGRNHNFHLWSNGLVRREVIIIHQNLWILVGSHGGFNLGVQMHVAAWDIDAQLVPLDLPRLSSCSLFFIDAGGSWVFIAGFIWNTASVSIFSALVHRWSETIF